MTTNQMTYDALYQSMKKRFTVVHDNCEYTLGGYMRGKAGEKPAQSSQLPVSVSYGTKSLTVVQNVFHYVENKLEVKSAPAPEKALTAFPFRTSLSALAAGFVVCTLALSFVVFGRWNQTNTKSFSASLQNEVKQVIEDDILPETTVFETNV